jgi:hypothetical protein
MEEVVAATEGSRTLQVRLGGEGRDGGGLMCMAITVDACMCIPSRKIVTGHSGLLTQKQQTRPWWLMWSVARFDLSGESKYSLFCNKIFGEIVGKGSARDGLVLENNERLPLCTPFLSRALPLDFTKIDSEHKSLQSNFTHHTHVHAHTHGDYSRSLRSQKKDKNFG